MSGLPSGWHQTTLGEIGLVQSGVGFPNELQGMPSGDFPVYKVGDVSRGVLQAKGCLRSAANYVSRETAASMKGYVFPVGATVFAKIGEALKLNRRGFVLCEGLADNNVMGFKAEQGISDRFVYYFLLTQDLAAFSRSTTVPSIRKGDVEGVEIPLPPLTEQTRLAAKLDELLAQVDTLKARIDGIPALLKRFRQSVLAAAVSGRLTEEWRLSNPVSESAEDYLTRVVQCRRLNPVVKFKEPVPPDLEKRDIDAPAGWVVASVSRFAECLDSMRVPVKKDLRNSGEGLYPYFGANGEVDRVDDYIFDDDLVMVTEDETFYGREKPIAYKYSGKCWVNNHVHALRAHDAVARDYLCYALMHYDVIPWLTGTTGRAKLTQGALLSLPLQVPPAAEQTEIVRSVEQLFAFADQLEARVNAARSRIDRLTQSILAKAFRGELVPQNPEDEPASVLLKRIQAQRAATPTAKRGRRKATSP